MSSFSTWRRPVIGIKYELLSLLETQVRLDFPQWVTLELYMTYLAGFRVTKVLLFLNCKQLFRDKIESNHQYSSF